MDINTILSEALIQNASDLFGAEISPNQIQIQPTKKEFEGDLTIVVFPFVKLMKCAPVQAGEKIGEFLKSNVNSVSDFNVVNGFLNLSISKSLYVDQFKEILSKENYGIQPDSGKMYMVEYSSPNTNKPLHLGHLRNIFLGYSCAEILKANGHKVIKTQIINDRGIHICKSMLAWQRMGNGETPETAGIKGDKFVGKYYVEFDKALKEETTVLLNEIEAGNFQNIASDQVEEIKKLQAARETKEDDKDRKAIQGKITEMVKNNTALMKDTKAMLQKWEQKDPEIYALWEKMNGWCYDGFNATYERMQVNFDTLYYESDTYLLGKDIVLQGLKDGIFYQKEDGSIWVDLTDEGLDHKLLLRSDGTAVYMTQDIGTAIERKKNYPELKGIIYTVGNEQDYHFQALFKILKKLGFDWYEECYHLSYGMVELPEGKMKSREGTVVDADDLMQEVVDSATEMTKERGHIEGMSETEKEELYETIGLGGLKYYLLKVDPKKKMMFNPKESIDLNGNTGPFIQYAHARIQSLMRKANGLQDFSSDIVLEEVELELIKKLVEFPEVIKEAGTNHSPALIANYTYDLVKSFNSFYQSISIFNEENEDLKNFRLHLANKTGQTIKIAMQLIGVKVPDQM
ncbi:MAG: arginine--tRNA ligase [Crocinitomicaceae bacterium]|nr:arginine--tRNA ligase [Crocinitomicaceae bacterium]